MLSESGNSGYFLEITGKKDSFNLQGGFTTSKESSAEIPLTPRTRQTPIITTSTPTVQSVWTGLSVCERTPPETRTQAKLLLTETGNWAQLYTGASGSGRGPGWRQRSSALGHCRLCSLQWPLLSMSPCHCFKGLLPHCGPPGFFMHITTKVIEPKCLPFSWICHPAKTNANSIPWWLWHANTSYSNEQGFH